MRALPAIRGLGPLLHNRRLRMRVIRTQGPLLQVNPPNPHKGPTMPAPQTVLTLIENFERNLDAYRSGKYNETQVRRDFIDPLFKALGWDMDNSAGYAEAYRDVIHEDAIKIGSSTKAPDYSFRVGGQRKFFLEAKKPSVNVKDDIEPAFQLRRYAWSAKLPLSIVTDFEEFAIYDCRAKPDKGDKASKARLFYCTFHDYADKWDEIAAIFSKEAVLKGSFDKYAGTNKGKRGTTEVDSAFLEEIEGWRDLLARNIALRNSALVGAPTGRDSRAGHAPTESPCGLSQRELNFAVQQTIDRIIFLRICEDRGIEPYGRLMALQNGVNVYGRLRELFRDADERYNSGLFHFKREKGRAEAPDELTLNLEIDDKPLKEIFKNLYYPDCPYEFSVLGADILGSVYEQFLGKVIRLTAGNRAVVEDKPEVKKAGGVFYTPAYIVKYIVEHTVGKLLEDKSSKQAAGIAILDPACGSGSFLIGAYQYLLDWYLARYIEEGAEKHSKGKNARLRHSTSGEWRLTTSEKKRILLEHIYGVDIDAQAVEVTKLSLLLKVLEGESDQTLTSQMKLFHERVLPDLERNIQCGNSLIGPDFYDSQLDLDDEAARRINVFDWQAAFPQVFNSDVGAPPGRDSVHKRDSRAGRAPTTTHSPSGGFDVVIGNPPYGFHQIHSEQVKPYLKNKFDAAHGSYEHYFLFYEATLRLLKVGGMHGFIVPVTWLTIPSAYSLRKFVLDNFWVQEIEWLPELVFSNAQVNTLISIIQNAPQKDVCINIHNSLGFKEPASKTVSVSQSQFISSDYSIAIFESQEDTTILEKITSKSLPLSQFAMPCSGYNPYEVGKGLTPEGGAHTKATVSARPYHSAKQINANWKPEIGGKNLRRYYLQPSKDRWVKYGTWLAAARNPENFLGPRILVQEITGGADKRIVATYCEDELYYSRDVIPIKPIDGIALLYLLGIINSWLITWYHQKRSPKSQKGLFPKVLVSDLKDLPIVFDPHKHDKLVALVEKMLALHQQLTAAKTPQDTTLLQRQIDATDKQIDQLVYALYGLTDEEIALVEGA
ncbi:MAG: N-6 DNA methylase [Gallionella sp.]|nr:N-6 DNA methylase [Gallionella sp.]